MSLFEINAEIIRPDQFLVRELARIPTANLSDAMANLNTMHSTIHAVSPAASLCGPACTVSCRCGDFLAILQGLDAARPGDILVVDNQGSPDTAIWGEITTAEAQRRGLGGLVADGLVRDLEGIRRRGFPVFARGAAPRVAGRGQLGEVNVTICCGGVAVSPGDIVVGDADGVVVVPQRKAQEVLRIAQAIGRYEEELLAKVADGRSQVEIYQLHDQFESLRRAHSNR
jgi:regulator of RNase E activity RraA